MRVSPQLACAVLLLVPLHGIAAQFVYPGNDYVVEQSTVDATALGSVNAYDMASGGSIFSEDETPAQPFPWPQEVSFYRGNVDVNAVAEAEARWMATQVYTNANASDSAHTSSYGRTTWTEQFKVSFGQTYSHAKALLFGHYDARAAFYGVTSLGAGQAQLHGSFRLNDSIVFSRDTKVENSAVPASDYQTFVIPVDLLLSGTEFTVKAYAESFSDVGSGVSGSSSGAAANLQTAIDSATFTFFFPDDPDHKVTRSIVFDTAAAVPEPGIPAMLVAGAGLLGIVTRRRLRRSRMLPRSEHRRIHGGRDAGRLSRARDGADTRAENRCAACCRPRGLRRACAATAPAVSTN